MSALTTRFGLRLRWKAMLDRGAMPNCAALLKRAGAAKPPHPDETFFKPGRFPPAHVLLTPSPWATRADDQGNRGKMLQRSASPGVRN